jgi:hypothetical protein
MKIVCCENMSITCFVSCLEMWNVIWKMRFKFVFCKDYLRWFILVIMLDHLIVNFFWSSSLTFDEWRMLILDYRVTYVCSRFVEWRMFVFDFSSDVYDKTSLNLTKHLIKLIVSDSSSLRSENVISSNLTKTTHQIWRKKRHLIKSNERVISSNFFEKKDSLFTFWWANFCSDTWCEKLSLAKDSFLCEDKCLCEIVMISERS